MKEVLSIDQGVRFSNSYAEWLHVGLLWLGWVGAQHRSCSRLLGPQLAEVPQSGLRCWR